MVLIKMYSSIAATPEQANSFLEQDSEEPVEVSIQDSIVHTEHSPVSQDFAIDLNDSQEPAESKH